MTKYVDLVQMTVLRIEDTLSNRKKYFLSVNLQRTSKAPGGIIDVFGAQGKMVQ